MSDEVAEDKPRVEHSPLPWGTTKAGSIMVDEYHQSEAIYQLGQQNLVGGCFNDVAGGEDVARANAAYIVKACNAYPELVAMVQSFVEGFDKERHGNSPFYAKTLNALELLESLEEGA